MNPRIRTGISLLNLRIYLDIKTLLIIEYIIVPNMYNKCN